ncbi:hypothetical protein [Membranihabitans maritimus]|uniref:hypothetical protein n=1 Tax=Membranihabitans maritimus TaxID=2904244 RepID=UPI001F2F6A8D|nr:hypothetical protein [Membranihabitans maritimus]
MIRIKERSNIHTLLDSMCKSTEDNTLNNQPIFQLLNGRRSFFPDPNYASSPR